MRQRALRIKVDGERVVGFRLAFLFPARKREELIQAGTKGINQPTWKKTQGADIIRDWEDK